MNQTKYKRIILKISGEILGSREEGEPIHAKSLENICAEIKAVADMGVEIGLVVGGGNIFRGLQGSDKGIDRTTGDSMGMLATVINGLALMDRLEKIGAVVRVQRDPHGQTGRTLHSKAGDSSLGAWPNCNFCFGYRKSIFFH